MDAEIVIDNDFATLIYHPVDKIVHHEFKSSTTIDALKGFFLAGMNLLKEREAAKWLSDDRNFPIMDPEYAAWARNEWEPQALAAGWKYWAVVMPLRMMARMNIEDLVVQCAQKGLTVRSFEDPDEAYAWLKGCG